METKISDLTACHVVDFMHEAWRFYAIFQIEKSHPVIRDSRTVILAYQQQLVALTQANLLRKLLMKEVRHESVEKLLHSFTLMAGKSAMCDVLQELAYTGHYDRILHQFSYRCAKIIVRTMREQGRTYFDMKELSLLLKKKERWLRGEVTDRELIGAAYRVFSIGLDASTYYASTGEEFLAGAIDMSLTAVGRAMLPMLNFKC